MVSPVTDFLKAIALHIDDIHLKALFSRCDDDEYQWEVIHQHLLLDDAATAALASDVVCDSSTNHMDVPMTTTCGVPVSHSSPTHPLGVPALQYFAIYSVGKVMTPVPTNLSRLNRIRP